LLRKTFLNVFNHNMEIICQQIKFNGEASDLQPRENVFPLVSEEEKNARY